MLQQARLTIYFEDGESGGGLSSQGIYFVDHYDITAIYSCSPKSLVSEIERLTGLSRDVAHNSRQETQTS